MKNNHVALASEIKELENILTSIPEENIIEKISFQERLDTVKGLFEKLGIQETQKTTRLTFRGNPVSDSHGIAADFGGKAADYFSQVFSAIYASLSDSLRDKGPIADKNKNQLLIVGTAVGSFGFEFELPGQPQVQSELFPPQNIADETLDKIHDLLVLSANGSDDDVTELVDMIHPRAVKTMADFLGYLQKNNAWCGIEFDNKFFRYTDIEQLGISVDRLKENNIKETTEEHIGEFQGVLPQSRTFEFKTNDEDTIIKGKLAHSIDDPDILNRDWLHKPVKTTFSVVQVGQGKPRFTFEAINNISELKISN